MRYLLDSWAWVEYLDGTEAGLKVRDLFLKQNDMFTSILTLSELVSRAKRVGKDSEEVFNSILLNSKIINVNQEIAKEAGLIHAEIKKKSPNFGLIDAIILISARKVDAKVVTGDKHFNGMKDVIFLK